METGTMVGILTAFISGGLASELVKALIGWIKGRQAREQTVWQKYDAEVRYRRRVEESLQDHRHRLRELGVPYSEMPAVPTPPKRGHND